MKIEFKLMNSIQKVIFSFQKVLFSESFLYKCKEKNTEIVSLEILLSEYSSEYSVEQSFEENKSIQRNEGHFHLTGEQNTTLKNLVHQYTIYKY